MRTDLYDEDGNEVWSKSVQTRERIEVGYAYPVTKPSLLFPTPVFISSGVVTAEVVAITLEGNWIPLKLNGTVAQSGSFELTGVLPGNIGIGFEYNEIQFSNFIK